MVSLQPPGFSGRRLIICFVVAAGVVGSPSAAAPVHLEPCSFLGLLEQAGRV